jgi:hypothetical protein
VSRKRGAGVGALFQHYVAEPISSEWYSPPEIVDPCRSMLDGRFALDPASCAVANHLVKADRFMTEADDGLAGDTWEAPSVWLNPPSPPGPWWDKLVRSYSKGLIGWAVFFAYSIDQLAMVQVRTPKLFAEEWRRSSTSVVLLRDRVRFMLHTGQMALDGTPGFERGKQPMHGSALIVLGTERSKVQRYLGTAGWVP